MDTLQLDPNRLNTNDLNIFSLQRHVHLLTLVKGMLLLGITGEVELLFLRKEISSEMMLVDQHQTKTQTTSSNHESQLLSISILHNILKINSIQHKKQHLQFMNIRFDRKNKVCLSPI